MKHTITIKILPLCGMALITSCAYYPQLVDVPLIREKGDTRVDVGIAIAPPIVRASVSHGLTKNIALQVAGDIGANDEYYAQSAVGFYKNKQNRNVMELYGGFGYGYSKAGRMPKKVSGYYQTYFTQFNYGNINRGKNATTEYAFGLKTGYRDAKPTEIHYYDTGKYSINDFRVNIIFLEPTLFFRTGWENLKFQMGLGLCWDFRINRPEYKYPRAGIFNLGLGINYRL